MGEAEGKSLTPPKLRIPHSSPARPCAEKPVLLCPGRALLLMILKTARKVLETEARTIAELVERLTVRKETIRALELVG